MEMNYQKGKFLVQSESDGWRKWRKDILSKQIWSCLYKLSILCL